MKVCTDSALYESLNYCQGKSILPGIRQFVYYIRKADIVKWPSLGHGLEVMRDGALYADSFTLASDAKWHKIQMTLDKGVVEWETQGDKPSRTILNKATLHHPENDDDAAGFARQAIADDLVYVVRDRFGRYRVLGNEMFETDTKVSGTTGEGITGEVGVTIEIEVTDICPAPFYRGNLVTEDGTISCVDGEPVAS